ncbi:nitrate reductase associated protein [Cyanobium sp. NIES-981]|uniref:nitrate reductase associated protein n=1 Tax=Cyanobium sp. NIES-981 TaxID=1851505 RepID=UPI0007DD9098|nr:nitrate reductase associated protein [Cyanobium sp. NIES-981]SBO44167.1 conserved protein of unknown function [Cyanobium sp. NIES-981]
MAPVPPPRQAAHCFGFESDFLGHWRCIPLCLRRKLDLAGIKLKLSHWLAMSEAERQALVQWPDDPAALRSMADHLHARTAHHADGAVKRLPIPTEAPWQCVDRVPAEVNTSAGALGFTITAGQWMDLSELERFALCKLARPGHDHHNLAPALAEVFAATGTSPSSPGSD